MLYPAQVIAARAAIVNEASATLRPAGAPAPAIEAVSAAIPLARPIAVAPAPSVAPVPSVPQAPAAVTPHLATSVAARSVAAPPTAPATTADVDFPFSFAAAAAPAVVETDAPPSVYTSAPPIAALPVRSAPRAEAAPQPPEAAAPPAWSPPVAAPSAPPPSRRRADDLMTEIFEAMHDLHFLRDGVEGAEFVLTLLRDKLPTHVALFHFYDINTKEFVVVRSRAPRSEVEGMRIAEAADMLGDAVRASRVKFVEFAAMEPRWSRVRYERAGYAPHQILVAPIRHGRRFLGAIELADHVDGGGFGEPEINALTYVAEQVAEFLNDRGVSLVAESERPPPMPTKRR